MILLRRIFKVVLKRWDVFFFAVLFAIFFLQRAPVYLSLSRIEGTELSTQFVYWDTHGSSHTLDLKGPTIIVFWASWCGPCSIELARLHQLVKMGSIPSEAILALSMDTKLEDVTKAEKDRHYSFPLYWDKNSEIARQYSIQGTPTLLLVNRDKTIHWGTMGLSPSLEIRVLSFLRKDP